MGRDKEVENMIIIAGLGNPTKEYEGTRHNVGFQVIDKIAEKYNIAVDAKKGVPMLEKESSKVRRFFLLNRRLI